MKLSFGMCIILILITGCDSSSWKVLKDPPVSSVVGGSLYIGAIDSIDQITDGDTIKNVRISVYTIKEKEKDLKLWPQIEIKNNDIVVITSIRIAGIDAPDWAVSRQKSDYCRKIQKDKSIQAENLLKSLIGTKFLLIPIEDEKYGRMLAHVFGNKDGKLVNVADELLNNKLAVKYSGGTKDHDWCKD